MHTNMKKSFVTLLALMLFLFMAVSCRTSSRVSSSVSKSSVSDSVGERRDSVAYSRTERDSAVSAVRDERTTVAAETEKDSFEELVTERIVEQYDTAGRKVVATFRRIVRTGSRERQSASVDSFSHSGSFTRTVTAAADSTASSYAKQTARSEQRADSLCQSAERGGKSSASSWWGGFKLGLAAFALLAIAAVSAYVFVSRKTK